MSSDGWELVVDGFGRPEAPCFDADGLLCFADMRPPGVIRRLGGDGQVAEIVGREHVGGLVEHVGGGLVMSGPDVSVLEPDGTFRELLGPGDGWGFNDLATDAAGNIWVGKFGERPTGQPGPATGSLWRIGADGSTTECYGDVGLTNGIGLSPDGSRIYHNDTIPKVVYVSDLADGGLPTNRRVFHHLQYGSPDGLAMDELGGVWVAAMGSGKIVRVNPDGDQDLVIDTPSNWPASVCFGGSDGRDLYVFTFGGAPYDEERTGAVFRRRVGTAGAPVHVARA